MRSLDARRARPAIGELGNGPQGGHVTDAEDFDGDAKPALLEGSQAAIIRAHLIEDDQFRNWMTSWLESLLQ